MKTIKKAFVASLPVMAGYLVLSTGFGMLLASKGYGVFTSLAMSVFIYAGSMQFVAVDLIANSASLIAVALTTVMVNARHLFYGISMIDKYKNVGKGKPYMIFALTDETYSLVCADNDMNSREYSNYCLYVSVFNHLYWITGSVLGVLIGMILPFDVTGIDFALTALFLTVATKQWTETKDHMPAIIGAVSSLLCLFIFGKDNFLIPTMIIMIIALYVLRLIRGDKDA
ncbi:MAG: AzlC family ABC transporter permease [Lachnospiraceae bacterium]|nr:AzlC family ABC transporter permease [Candidatus Colinaster equi]